MKQRFDWQTEQALYAWDIVKELYGWYVALVSIKLLFFDGFAWFDEHIGMWAWHIVTSELKAVAWPIYFLFFR